MTHPLRTGAAGHPSVGLWLLPNSAGYSTNGTPYLQFLRPYHLKRRRGTNISVYYNNQAVLGGLIPLVSLDVVLTNPSWCCHQSPAIQFVTNVTSLRLPGIRHGEGHPDQRGQRLNTWLANTSTSGGAQYNAQNLVRQH